VSMKQNQPCAMSTTGANLGTQEVPMVTLVEEP